MNRLLALLPLWLVLFACADPQVVKKTLDDDVGAIKKANGIYARLCAPEEIANAEADAYFATIEFHEGDIRRAQLHTDAAKTWAKKALDKSSPCGTADRDKDKIPDIVDQCPDQPEDYDGVQDDDGCYDMDPNADDDGDGIKNIDDSCPDKAENFNGFQDDDGCPETATDQDGDGIIDPLDKCPTQAEDLDGYQDSDGCPDPDNDNDKVPDIHDQCPNQPEDIDGYLDEDGCPDPDNDGDGIPDIADQCPDSPGDRSNNGCPTADRDHDGIADVVDKCPDQPETKNGYLDDDGCPDTPPSHVKVTKTMVEITGTIQFESGQATLLPVSMPILNDVYKVLVDVPTMTLRIEGHTDSDGDDASNLKLSEDRAKAVRLYLQSKGVAANRLVSQGFGETRPIDTNRTAQGRAANRRVEFHITSP